MEDRGKEAWRREERNDARGKEEGKSRCRVDLGQIQIQSKLGSNPGKE